MTTKFLTYFFNLNQLRLFNRNTNSPSCYTSSKIFDFFSKWKWDVVIGSLFIIGVFWMPIYFYFNNITVANNMEESVGYRYFYSLRIASGLENSPMLPQGHLVTLYHVLIQYFLTYVLSLPEDQFFPRIDIFCMMANILPIFISWLLYIRLSNHVGNKYFMLLITSIYIFLMRSPNLPGGPSWTVLPDYHLWVIPVTLYSVILLVKNDYYYSSTYQKSFLWFFKIGILIGVAAGIKITYILIPGSIFMIYAFTNLKLVDFVKASFISLIFLIITMLLIYWTYARFANFTQLKYLLNQNMHFIQGNLGVTPISFSELHFEGFVPLLLTSFLIFLSIRHKHWNLLSIGAITILYSMFVLKRFYSHSLVEYHAFTLIPLLLFQHILFRYEYVKVNSITMRISILLLAGITLIFTFFTLWPMYIRDTPQYYKALNASAAKIHQILASAPIPIWLLNTNDSYHPHTIESALCKGKSAHYSPHMENIFPNFHCSEYAHTLTQEQRNSVTLGTIIFKRNESLPESILRIERDFEIDLSHSTCQDISDNESWPFVYCHPNKTVL